MPRVNECSASLGAEGRTFILTRGSWSNTYPIEDGERRLSFCERLRREHPKAKSSHDNTIEALSALSEKIARTGR